MLISINTSSERPIFEQIADAVRRAIGDGQLCVGDKLPAASEIAASLDVNKHTVLHAYQQLRDEGLVDLRRGRGALVTETGAALAELTRDAHGLVERAARLGIAADTLAALIMQPHLLQSTVEAPTRQTPTRQTPTRKEVRP